MKNKLTLLGSLVLAAAAILLWAQESATRRELEVRLMKAQTERDGLREQVEDLSKGFVSEGELARLRMDQREAIRLRGDVLQLKQAEAARRLAAASSGPASKMPPQAEVALRVEPLPEWNPDVRVHKTRLVSARIPSGDVIAMGGWETSPGKRTFALVRPMREGNGSDQISVTTKWLELSDEAAKRFGLGTYLDTSGEQSLAMSGVAFKDHLKHLEETEGVDVLSAPVVSTASGKQARLSITQSRDTPGGPVDFGPQLDVLPTLSEDGLEISLAIQASVVMKSEQ